MPFQNFCGAVLAVKLFLIGSKTKRVVIKCFTYRILERKISTLLSDVKYIVNNKE